MARSENQKLKILYILDYLQKYSYDGHPVRTKALLEMLEEKGIACTRTTIVADIAALQEYGADIVSLPGKNGGYVLASQGFSLPELKLLIDAVQSSRFLTEKKSRELIEKLCAQCSVHDAGLIRRDVLVSGRVKSMNETIYYNVDAIQEAIARNRQIRFRYFDWDIHGQRKYRDREYLASPYGLSQNNENCYLLAHSPRHGVTSYRVDRMSDIQLGAEDRTPCPELQGKALLRYANRLFQMFSGKETQVKLRFANHLAGVVIDRFGREVMMIPDGDAHFVCTAEVAVSPLFLSWVMGFGDQVKILYPQSVVEEFKTLCRQSLAQYQED